MEALKLKPIFKELIWGGTSLKTLLGMDLPGDRVGESWNVTFMDGNISEIEGGTLSGKSLEEVIDYDREGYLGKNLCSEKHFPLLVKLISAKDKLSVQVHPDDEYAQRVEGKPFGKAECWYIIDCPENSSLIIGLKDNVTKADFVKALKENNPEACLYRLPIKKGDCINIEAGLIHAITEDVVLAEVQQNSNITYRVYDYNRVDQSGQKRELHLEKSLEVIDFEGKIKKAPSKGVTIKDGDNTITYFIANKNFTLLEYNVEASITEKSDEDKFYIFTCLSGDCELLGRDFVLKLKQGDSVFIPAALGAYEIKGRCQLLKCFVPNVLEDFVEPLIKKGFSKEEIYNNCSVSE